MSRDRLYSNHVLARLGNSVCQLDGGCYRLAAVKETLRYLGLRLGYFIL